ncbi:MAG: penicillin acylase family protein [Kofleriaceae bacterium]
MDPALIHEMHFDDEGELPRLYRDLLAYVAGRDATITVGDLGTEPTTTGDRAARVLDALTSWVADGAHMRTTDARAIVAAAVMSRITTLSRWQANPAVACVYGGAQGGASFMVKDFEANGAAIVSEAVADLVVQVADEAWAMARPDLPSADPADWATPVAAADRTIGYQVNFTCLRPGPTGSCSLDPSHTTTVALDRSYTESLNSAHGSSYPMTARFDDLEASRALLPPGASEDPASPYFHDGLVDIVAKASGDVDSIPVAPRDRATVDATAISTLHFD